jgi:hypothetical protein
MTRLALVGAFLAAIALAATALAPGRALFGWLAALAFWAGVPVGALALLLVMRILPGPWSDALEPFPTMAARLLPLVALGALPLAFDFGVVYPWVHEAPETAFRAAWLAPPFWVARATIFLAAGTALAFAPGYRPLAIAGLIAFVPFHTVISFDWLMSVDPEFHSSGYGLYLLSAQVLTAFAVFLSARLATDPGTPDPLGALFLVLLLLWAYATFMPFFISWSGNLPGPAAWYGRRTHGLWAPVFPLVAALHATPTLLLLLRRFRASRRALAVFAGLVLAGKALETAWLVLPEAPPGPLPILAFLGALAGLGCLGLAGATWRRSQGVTP